MMLEVGLKMEMSGPLGRLRRMLARARDLKPLYRRWSQFLRSDAKQRLSEGAGFPALAESTQRRLRHTRTSPITVQGRVRKSYARRLEVQLRKQVRSGVLDEGVIGDLRALVWGGSSALVRELSDRRSKSLVRLQKQLQRARAGKRVGGDRLASESHHWLGKMSSSLKAAGTADEAVAESRVPWSRIHNEGGTAGHGAQIPARPFLKWSVESKRVLAGMAAAYLSGEKED